jgi:hypothetical protein
MALEQIFEENSVTGYVDKVPYAYGADCPLTLKSISYKEYTPTDLTGLTFQLLIKTNRSDADGSAIIDVANASMSITTSPLVVSYDVDTTTAGFLPNTVFYGEWWVVDATRGRDLIKEFQLHLSDPIKNTFP